MTSKMYTCKGDIMDFDYLYMNDKPVFRKEFYVDSGCEREILGILRKKDFRNVVKIYKVQYLFFDMELLNTNLKINLDNATMLLNDMRLAKEELQKLGIIYIDWKLDNIGQNNSGQYKVFDFDTSGIISLETGNWISTPPKRWAYHYAINNNATTPKEIDDINFCRFEKEILQLASIQM